MPDWVMSALGQKRTYATQQAMSALSLIATAKADFGKPSCLLYPPEADMRCTSRCLLWAKSGHTQLYSIISVGERKQRRRHSDAERLGRLEIDNQFKVGRLYHWQFGRIFALENPAGINAGQAVAVQDIWYVGHQTASCRKFTIQIDRG